MLRIRPKGISLYDQAILQNRLWTPNLFKPAIWLDASDSSTITLSGSNVTSWNDKSGNARNLTQTTPAQQPTYQATGLNSRPTVRFDGIDDAMQNTAYSFGNSPSFAYAVFQSSNAAGSLGQIFMASPNPSNTSIGTELLYINNYGGYTTITLKPPSLANASLGVNTTFVTTPQIIGAGFDGSGTSPSDVEFILNGTQQTSTTSGPIGYVSEIGFSIGNRPIQQIVGLNGTISELIFFDSFIFTTNRQIIEGYLAWKWGLQNLLIATHPFANRPPLIGD